MNNKVHSLVILIKYIVIFLLLFILYFIVSAYHYSITVSENISQAVFRLHVLANSDSEEDQQLKLLVRDAILDYSSKVINHNLSRDENILILKEHSEELKKIADEVIKTNGYNYPVEIAFGNFWFPTKAYSNISLPAGYYDGLQIKIGEAKRS